MRTTSFTAAVYLACLSICATSSAQSFAGLGDLAGGSFESFAGNLSSDGSFVTGVSTSTVGGEAFLWTQGTGMVGLGMPSGSASSEGTAVSDDGGTVAGSHMPDVPFANPRAMQWTSNSAADFDPFPVGALGSSANDTSANGAVIVGSYIVELVGTMAYHWKNNVLTTIDGGGSTGLSANGEVVVGVLGDVGSSTEAFRWTAGGGVVGLGELPGGLTNSSALGVSADGQVVVGDSDSTLGLQAFRWTEATNMVGLGFLTGGSFSSATDTTADGSIVVGIASMGADSDPFIWDDSNGIRNLVDVLTNDFGLGIALTGWDLIEATAISDDGRVIIGNGINPDGNFEGWIARIPEPGTALLGVLASLGLQFARRRCS
ncbi:PEP-CTERM sorting domain-containing protein [Bythopirellula polymerisocia]|uniref:PEP-CTERM protein-sorting domain-containing protein n=1 Tax=Bythopirellula polymerisocia TaxID=2528003 RepID=A0A5C6CH37_9BACT|nr:PEP-CTERM sorting domain-containing protein [Bythopirellula polymerisocia]TWU22591.1 hypothetical protein Pla144_40510 [Bythopirellula polymerisocia]